MAVGTGQRPVDHMLGENVAHMTFRTARIGQLGHVMGAYMVLAAVAVKTVDLGAGTGLADHILYGRIVAEMAGLAVVVVGHGDNRTHGMAVTTVAHCIDPAMGVGRNSTTLIKNRYIHVLTLVVDLVPVKADWISPVTVIKPFRRAVFAVSAAVFKDVFAISGATGLQVIFEDIENASARSRLVFLVPAWP